MYGYALEGMTENTQKADNLQTFYPLTKRHSKFPKDRLKILPKEYQKFFKKFDKIVVIAFGTTNMPSYEDMMQIFKAI